MKTQADIIVEKSGIIVLNASEVIQSRAEHGRNEIANTKNHFISIVIDLLKVPMLILLEIASIIYFLTGNIGDGLFMLVMP